MSDPLSAFVGRSFAGEAVAVERWLAYLWADATANPDDAFRYPDDDGVQYAPPTLGQVVARRAADVGDIEGELRGGDWAAPNVFLGGHRFRFDRPLRVGTRYRAEAEVTDVESKSGSSGEFQLLTVAYAVETVDGTPAYELETDFVVARSEERDSSGSGSAERGSTGSEASDGGAIDPGTPLATRTVEDVGADAMKLVTAVVGDPNPMHYDPEYAARQGYPGRVNQGPLNASYAAQAALAVADSPVDLRALEVRYDGFVFEGETVTATATADAPPEPGSVVDLALALRTDDGERVLTGSAAVRVGTESGTDSLGS